MEQGHEPRSLRPGLICAETLLGASEAIGKRSVNKRVERTVCRRSTGAMRRMDIEQLSTDPRVTVRCSGQPAHDGTAVVYWMQRAQRASDNPALETAIVAANALGKPVVVYFALVARAAGANLRHYHFMVQGLRDVTEDLVRRGIGFVLRRSPDHDFLRFCDEVRPALVIGDENPLRRAEQAKQRLAAQLRVPFWTVDADVIVPSRLLEKEQYAARTIRPRIHRQLPQFLRPIRRHVPRHTWKIPRRLQTLHPDLRLLEGFPIDRSVSPVAVYRGGSHAARQALRHFVAKRLRGYGEHRNHPEQDATSRLSPYLHFGHIGPHTVALAVRNADAPARDREAFLEESIVRRELAVNFVRYNPAYDRLSSAEPWAQRTLAAHRADPRPHFYTPRQLEQAETHDVLWNAAQRQMVCTGWMHGYLRMYWAKKILEWSESPEAAYEIAVTLNDRYELDGRDPNGYAGVAWGIAGKHDRAWGPERPIYGTIRYMSYASTSRKFDSKAYIERMQAPGEERST
jgi:deoxyribodipyrimidine photo-lyase